MDKLRARVPPHVYNILLNANIDSIKIVISMAPRDLQQLTKLSNGDLENLQREAVSLMTQDKFITVLDLQEQATLSTGCTNIDQLLNCGISSCTITEITGKSGCGKTQLCLQLLVTVQYPFNNGGFNAGAVYISTEDSFPSKRLHQLCINIQDRLGQLEDIQLEDNVFVDHIADYEQFRRCLCIRLPKLLLQKNIRLLVIDSIAGVWRHDNENVNYYERSQDILHVYKQLKELAYKHNLAIVCVNQVMDNINTGEVETCLGLTWSNLINTRLFITRTNSDVRKMLVKYSTELAYDYCTFIITKDGVVSNN